MNEFVNVEQKFRTENPFGDIMLFWLFVAIFWADLQYMHITVYQIFVQFAKWFSSVCYLFCLLLWRKLRANCAVSQSFLGVVSSSSSPIHINESMNLPTLCGCSKLGWWFVSIDASVGFRMIFSSSGDWSSLVFSASYTSSWFSISLDGLVAGTEAGRMSSIGFATSFGFSLPGNTKWFFTSYL